MNVTDQWMLERMQQMAASLTASLTQTSQNTQTPKSEKGESFQDMMSKAKDQKVEAPRKDAAPDKREPVQSKEQPQPAENTAPQQHQPVKAGGRTNFDLTLAAFVAAGFAQVEEVFEDGTAIVTLDGLKVDGIFARGGVMPENGQLPQMTVVTGDGQEIVVTPQQLQEVFSRYGLEGPTENGGGLSMLGQIDLSKPEFENMTVIDMDGKVTTMGEMLKDLNVQADTEEQDETNLDAEMLASDQPLFKDVKAAPVKVGENFMLDTQQPDMEQVLADTVRYAAQAGIKEVELMLSPRNLGALTIKLTQSADGILQVVFHTSNAKAANLLNQHLDSLNTMLQGYNQSEVRVEVQHSENSQQAGQQFQQADPDGHNQQQKQQQQQQEHSEHDQDFFQRLRLGLFGLDDAT